MNNRDQMHPQDIRNLILFAVLSISMWLAYDHFVARPQAEIARKAAIQKQVEAAKIPTDAIVVKSREEIISGTGRVKIDTPHFSGSINLTGARLDDLQLKNFYKTVDKKEPVSLLSPAKTPYPRYVESGWVAQGAMTGLPDAETVWRVSGNDVLTTKTPVMLFTEANGLRFEKTFSVDEDHGFLVESRISNNSGKAVTLYPFALATEHGLPEDFQNLGVIHEGPIAYTGEKLQEETYKKLNKKKEERFEAKNGWIGLTGKYWLTALVPADQSGSRFRFVASPSVGPGVKDRYQVDLTGQPAEIAPGADASYKIYVFAGAKKLTLLEGYEKKWNLPHFDLAVDFGWFYFLTKPFFLIINFLFGLTGNFGIAIILFTCALRVLIFPLANTSYRSFAKLRQVSPEMYEIRHKYKDDKQKLQEELVKLYQKHNVNPMAGCLPIIVQIPIFFSLYKVLSNTIEMRHAPFYGWIKDLSAHDPTTIFNLFGLIPWTPPSFLMIGALPILMMIAMIVQKNLSPPPEDPIQARLIAIMPYFMTFVMAKFASGLVLYWTVNNVLAIIQQVIIMKSMGVPVHLFGKDQMQKKLEKEIEEGPSVHPSLEMIEEKVEEAVENVEGKTVSAPKPKKKKKK
jgi:YidC/Oxa1 family membrane protein insertase